MIPLPHQQLEPPRGMVDDAHVEAEEGACHASFETEVLKLTRDGPEDVVDADCDCDSGGRSMNC